MHLIVMMGKNRTINRNDGEKHKQKDKSKT
jgi:hypothetical protein